MENVGRKSAVLNDNEVSGSGPGSPRGYPAWGGGSDRGYCLVSFGFAEIISRLSELLRP
jgi:hypothetical protein